LTAAANTTGNPEQGSNTENLLPLDAPELVVWVTVAKMVLGHVFRRITQADWKVYFTGGAEVPDSGNEIADMDANALAFYRRVIVRVQGYRSGDGRMPETLPSWPECIPLEDRLAAVDLLLKTFWTFTVDSLAADKSGRRVSFEILSSDGKPGPMRRYFSAVHHFRPPTEKHREQFFLARAMHADEGESPFTTLISIYDELIERVEGYSVSGRELRSREKIVREMDAYHKAIAVGLLLEPHALRHMRGKAVAATVDAIGPKLFAGLGSGKVLH